MLYKVWSDLQTLPENSLTSCTSLTHHKAGGMQDHEGARNCFSTEQKKSAQQTAEDNTEFQAVGQHPEAAFASPESNHHSQ